MPSRTRLHPPRRSGIVVIGGRVCHTTHFTVAHAAATMKIVLSHKGFDSSNGGFPSLVLPDGTVVPLPFLRTGVRRGFESFDGVTARSEPSLTL